MRLIEENRFIESLVKALPRSPRQLNALQQSDAELIRLNDDIILALTTDSICEEIDCGLYDDPFHIGWMTVAVNMSDLAAVGASPLGLLLDETFTSSASEQFIGQLQHGISAACMAYAVPVLGGDTNRSSRLQMSAAAIGTIEGRKPLMRTGCSPGDALYASGMLGGGNAYAFMKLSGCSSLPFFRPEARIAEGRVLSDHASCCMDTSDGLIAALDQLMRLNGIGFDLTLPVSGMLADDAKAVCSANTIPEWFMLAGPHGEFELVFTIPQANENRFLEEAHRRGWSPVRLGHAIAETALSLYMPYGPQRLDTATIRNLFTHADLPLENYLVALHAIEYTWRQP